MEKGLLFLTLSMLSLWLIMDEFLGDKRVTVIAYKLTPQSKPIKWKDDEQAAKDKKKIKEEIDKDDSLTDKEKKTKKDFWDNFYGDVEPH